MILRPSPARPQTAVNLELVLDLKLAVDRAFNRASDLLRSLDFDLEHADGPIGNLDLHLGLELACTRSLDFVRDIDCAHEALSTAVTGTFHHDPGFTRALIENCDFDLASTRARALDLARAIDEDRTRAIEVARDVAQDFVTEVELARRRVSTFAERLSIWTAHPGQQLDGSAHVRISPLAGRVAGAAARLLPSADRSRYAEEYHAELHELAHISRGAQWAYAARLLAYALPLRHELRRDTREVAQWQ